MAKKSRRKVNPPNSGGGHLPRQEQPPSIQRQEELELGQLLSNLSTETTAPCWMLDLSRGGGRQRWEVTGSRLLLPW